MAVLEHSVNPRVINTGQKYGCFNRPDFQPVAYGAACYGSQAFPHVMSHDCRFDLSETDARCTGCHRVGQGKQYDEMVRSLGK
mgnify:CR=1 FL=1